MTDARTDARTDGRDQTNRSLRFATGDQQVDMEERWLKAQTKYLFFKLRNQSKLHKDLVLMK